MATVKHLLRGCIIMRPTLPVMYLFPLKFHKREIVKSSHLSCVSLSLFYISSPYPPLSVWAASYFSHGFHSYI
ncbi:hypothetical protein XENTR_v10008016 [Xenopus tropicalis]|nr:hypothetical protein XENTR_v10008016 [Xenopus tropicalis]